MNVREAITACGIFVDTSGSKWATFDVNIYAQDQVLLKKNLDKPVEHVNVANGHVGVMSFKLHNGHLANFVMQKRLKAYHDYGKGIHGKGIQRVNKQSVFSELNSEIESMKTAPHTLYTTDKYKILATMERMEE